MTKQYSYNMKKILLDYVYVDSVHKLDTANYNEQIVQYFSIVGMDDPDIAHSLMSVKEMIHCKYEVNSSEQFNNDEILTGKLNGRFELQNYRLPIFQANVLARVPQVDRARLFFPVNICDFIFDEGV